MLLDYAWLIPFIPLVAFGVIALIGRYMPQRGGWLAFVSIATAGVIGLLVALDVWQNRGHGTEAFVWTLEGAVGHAWLEAGSFTFDLGVYIDNLTAWLLFPVGLLTTGIALYSLGYMAPEKDGYHTDEGQHIHVDGRQRYYAALALFVAGMLGFVVGSNLLMLFIFWELMGLCSYLLIGYWYAKPSAAHAAQKAFLVTRVGDVFFLVGLIVLTVLFGSIDLAVLLDADNIAAVQASDGGALGIALLCLFIGAVGKSAQFPLHVWLPDAMEGPTTVSALIHAATMVKAGVFLVARFFPLFAAVDWVLLTVGTIGAFTALLAASMATVNNDIKRVLAFSTISQLGYMFLGLGAGLYLHSHGYTTALLHLLNHAFFKALLFLCAGVVGYKLHAYDMRRFGGLRKHMPITATTMLIGTLAISGVPPFSGFFSKDELLASVYHAGAENPLFLVLYVVALGTALLTAYYMFRLWFMTFLGEHRGEHEDKLGDGTWHMSSVLTVLAAFAVLTGLAVFFAGEFVFYEEELHFSLGHMLAAWQTYAGLAASGVGIWLAWSKWGPSAVASSIRQDDELDPFQRLLLKRYYLTEIYYAAVDKVVIWAAIVTDAFDRLVIDATVDGVGSVNAGIGQWGRKLQTGRVSDYAVGILAGLLGLIVVVVYVLRYTLGRSVG